MKIYINAGRYSTPINIGHTQTDLYPELAVKKAITVKEEQVKGNSVEEEIDNQLGKDLDKIKEG